MVWVAAAGPGANVFMAVVAALLLHGTPLLPATVDAWAVENLQNAMFINALLAVFNMIPIPPLDGGRVAVGLLPDFLAEPLARMERIGFFVVLGAVFLLPMAGIDFFGGVIWPAAEFLLRSISALTGLA